MFFSYLQDKKSWILFFLLSLVVTDGLIWMDKGLSVKLGSLFYLNGLLAVSFFLFLIWRYFKEMGYTKKIQELIEAGNDWEEALPDPRSNQDRIVNRLLKHYAKESQRKVANLQAYTLQENDYTTAWVHEVKAPLTGMKMTIDAHQRDPIMQKIEAEWLRVHLLIDRQLYISRLSTLHTDYLVEKIDMHDLVTPEIRELRSWCMEKKIAVEFEGEHIEAITDKKWSRFIIRQLLTNAVKYSPEGGTITISAERLSNGQARLTIKDEGPGIPNHDLPRIFDKGFTGSTGRLHNAATGLGLYLSRQVAEKMGISLTAQSHPKNGTALQMTFSTNNDFDATRT